MAIKFEEVKEYTNDLVSSFQERNNMDDAIDEMILMEWDEEASMFDELDDVKITKSPDARNQALGAVRLLTSADPEFAIPLDNDKVEITPETSETIELACKAMWDNAGRLRGDPIHYDVVRSGVYYSDIFMGITSTQDLLDYSKGGPKALQIRAEQAAMKTPYLFEVYRPTTCYPDYDQLGLARFYQEEETDRRTIENMYGELSKAQVGDMGAFDTVTKCDYFDYEYRYLWIKGADEPIIQGPHGLPFIPRVAQIVEGSLLFTEEEQRRQPFLYSLYKSGLWKRLNLMYTVMFTQIMVLGLNAQFIEEMGSERTAEVDYSVMGGRWLVPPGGRLYPLLDKGIVDPGTKFGLEVADKLLVESTIFKQTLGEPLGGGDAPFSAVALLSQAGRLPLIITQRKAGWAIAEAMSIALRWIKHENGREMRYANQDIQLTADDIPDNLDLQATLEVDLPQDLLQQANIAQGLAGGPSPIMPKRWAREKLLKEGQSEALQREINTEQAADFYFQMWLQTQKYIEDMAMQQLAQGGMVPGAQPGPQGPMPPQGPQGPGGQPEPFTQYAPNEMVTGGMQGPEPMPGQQPPEEMGGL